jgi:hypothetical protein
VAGIGLAASTITGLCIDIIAPFLNIDYVGPQTMMGMAAAAGAFGKVLLDAATRRIAWITSKTEKVPPVETGDSTDQ